jgi:MOSC domain-containing protein YiiM
MPTAQTELSAMAGTIDSIHLASSHGEPQREVSAGSLTVGVGLEGDRYASAAGGIVTLIEAEEVEQFNSLTGLAIAAADTGRNIVTRGVRLNDLVGRQFRIADVLMEGFELCEPCATLGGRLATDAVAAAEVVAAFTHKAGVRAFVRGTGDIAPGSIIDEA